MLNVLTTHGGEAMKTELTDALSSVDERVRSALGRGDRREALAESMRAYGRVLGRLCMAMLRSQSEAEDVVQETFVAAYEGFGEHRVDASLRAWLCGIARKKCLKALEVRRRREAKLVLLQGGQSHSVEAPSAEEAMQRRQRAERAHAALEAVRPSEREALILRYQCELDYQEVATACSVDEATARKRVSRGLMRMREALLVTTETEAS